jgi:hypothetical protein
VSDADIDAALAELDRKKLVPPGADVLTAPLSPPAAPRSGPPPEEAPLDFPAKIVSVPGRSGRMQTLPIDNEGEFAKPLERAAIMNLGLDNDTIESIYRQSGREVVRDENGRVLVIDRRKGVAVPVLSETKGLGLAEHLVPLAMAGAAAMGGGPGEEMAGAAEQIPGVGPAIATGMRFVGRRVLGRALKAGVAQFGTEEAARGLARSATGLDVPMDVKGAAERGLTTAKWQGATEGIGYGLARAGGVSPRAASETLAEPVLPHPGTTPGRAGVMFEKPAAIPFSGTPNLDVARSVGAKLDAAFKTMTPGRLATEDLLGSIQKSGAVIDIRPTLDALRKAAPTPVGQANRQAFARVNRLYNDIVDTYLRPATPKGAAIRSTVSPQQADEIAHLIDGEVGDAWGKNPKSPYAKAIKGVYIAHKDSFYKQVGGLGEAAAQTKEQLDALRELADRASEAKKESPENFVKGMFGPSGVNRESNFDALHKAEPYLGTGRAIESAIRRANTKGEWTGSDARMAHYWFTMLLRTAARPAAKLMNLTSKMPGVYYSYDSEPRRQEGP